MKNFSRILVVLFLFVAATPVSKAAGPKEFFFNSAGFDLMGGANRISLAPGFNFGFFEWLQAGGSLGYQSLAFGDSSVNTMTISLGPTFNLGGPYQQATFIFFGFALRKGSGTVANVADDPAGSGMVFMVGRRIPVYGPISYRPSVGLQMAGRTTFVINALAVSYFF